MNKYGYSNDLQFDWYSSSFLQMLYNSPFVDWWWQKKSSLINEEDSHNSENNIKKKIRNHLSNSTKKIPKKNTFSLNKMDNMKISSI